MARVMTRDEGDSHPDEGDESDSHSDEGDDS